MIDWKRRIAWHPVWFSVGLYTCDRGNASACEMLRRLSCGGVCAQGDERRMLVVENERTCEGEKVSEKERESESESERKRTERVERDFRREKDGKGLDDALCFGEGKKKGTVRLATSARESVTRWMCESGRV